LEHISAIILSALSLKWYGTVLGGSVFGLTSLLVPGWKPKGSIKAGLCVCPSVRPCVRPCVTDYLKNRSEDFSEIWYEVGGKKYKKHSTAVFLKKFPVFSKTALFCQKNAKNMVFDTLCKNDSDNFSKNLIKCVNKWPLCFGQKL